MPHQKVHYAIPNAPTCCGSQSRLATTDKARVTCKRCLWYIGPQKVTVTNPLRVHRLYNIVTATKGTSASVLYLNPKDKFTRTEVRAKRFANADAAIRHASAVLRKHPDLRVYHFSIRFAYG